MSVKNNQDFLAEVSAETAERIAQNTNIKEDWNLVLKHNAKMLDCLYRLSFCSLHPDDYDFLVSQLSRTPGFIHVLTGRIKRDQSQSNRLLDEVARGKSISASLKSVTLVLQEQGDDKPASNV